MAAAKAVLDTYELRENILDHLPATALSSTLLVNKAWHKTVFESKACRRTLYLSPTASTSFIVWKRTQDNGGWQPLLHDGPASEQGHVYPIVSLHPNLAIGIYEGGKTYFNFRYSLRMLLLEGTDTTTFSGVFITHPPVYKIQLVYRNRDTEEARHFLKKDEGMKASDLVKDARAYLEEKGLRESQWSTRNTEVSVLVDKCVEESSENVLWARGLCGDPSVDAARRERVAFATLPKSNSCKAEEIRREWAGLKNTRMGMVPHNSPK